MHFVWRAHFSPVAFRKCGPVTLRLRHLPAPEQCRAGREFGLPHIVEVPGGVLILRHATRRMTYGAEPDAFTPLTRTAETNDADRHVTADLSCRSVSPGGR